MYFEPDMFKVRVKVKVCHNDVTADKTLILLILAHMMANL